MIRTKNKPLVYVTLFSTSWALNIVFIKKVLLLGVHPLVVSSNAFLITIVLLTFYYFLFRRGEISKATKKGIKGAVYSGIIGSGFGSLLGYIGLNLSNSINYGFVIKTTVVFVLIESYIFLKEPLTKIKMYMALILILGAYLLSTGGQTLLPRIGDVIILLSALSLATANIIVRNIIRKDIHPDALTYIRAFGGFILTALAAYVFVGRIIEPQYFYMIFQVSLFQFLLLIFLQRTLAVASASYSSMMSMMTPVIVAIIATPLFGEYLNLVQWIGAGLIMFGGIMTQVKGVAEHN